LDLDGVTLVDVEVVRYFNACADGRIDSFIACLYTEMNDLLKTQTRIKALKFR
jgi:hypothetical protein